VQQARHDGVPQAYFVPRVLCQQEHRTHGFDPRCGFRGSSVAQLLVWSFAVSFELLLYCRAVSSKRLRSFEQDRHQTLEASLIEKATKRTKPDTIAKVNHPLCSASFILPHHTAQACYLFHSTLPVRPCLTG